MRERGASAMSRGARGPVVDFDLKQECPGPDVLKIGNFVFQHFYFTAIDIDIVDRDPSVGFQFPQKLPEPNEICLGGCLDHAPIVGRALPNEKELSTPKKRVRPFLHSAVALGPSKMLPRLRIDQPQT